MNDRLAQLRKEQYPFGAKILDNGKTRFRLWMPQQEKILPGGATPNVYFPDDDQSTPMDTLGEGWYELVCDAPHLTCYQYEIGTAPDGTVKMRVPDPMSYQQEDGVHGFSMVVDPSRLDWSAEPAGWQGVAHEDLIIYELHIGTFTKEGTYRAAIDKLDYLRELGITAIELLPIGATGCEHNWGYDEVLKAANHVPYGTPQDLADLVQESHRRGIGVVLDIVDNHMGPEGNYYWLHTPELWRFADYETLHKTPVAERRIADGYSTPWGPAFDLTRWEVRTFFSQKNLWLQETYRLDGVRRDAVHALKDGLYEADPAHPHFLEELHAQAKEKAQARGVPFPVILEYEDNRPSQIFADAAHGAARVRGNAQWADDFHHAVRALLFSNAPEKGFIDKGYYKPYTEDAIGVLAEVLSRGSALSLDTARNHHREDADLATPFDPRRSIAFTRNHDQIGNTPNGERIEFLLNGDPAKQAKLQFESTLLMLNPMIPMMFMGQERALETPFPYFATWENHLRDLVRDGRAQEFSQYDSMADPCDPAIVEGARLPWPEDAALDPFLSHYRRLIKTRKRDIAPHLKSGVETTLIDIVGDNVLRAAYQFGDGARHVLIMNAGDAPAYVDEQRLGKGANGEIVRHAAGGPTLLSAWSIGVESTPGDPASKPRLPALDSPHISA